jgi:hypothetical protein
MSTSLNIAIGASAFVISAFTMPVWATSIIGSGTVAIGCSALFSSQLQQLGTAAAEKATRLWNSHQLSNGQVFLYTLSTSAGAYAGTRIAGLSGAVIVTGVASMAMLHRLRGSISAMDPVPPRADEPIVINHDSLLHLDSPFTVLVYYGPANGDTNILDHVICSSTGGAIECKKLTSECQWRHKQFFQREGLTANECRAFILARPVNEIDPQCHVSGLMERFNYLKFDLIQPSLHRIRPTRTADQELCRKAILATGSREITYPNPELITPVVIDRAIAFAVDQVIVNPGIAQAIALGAFAEVVRAGAEAGARAAVEARTQAGSFIAGALFEAAMAGAYAGLQAADGQLDRDLAIQAATEPGRTAGRGAAVLAEQDAQAGNRPIVASQNSIDMVNILKCIRRLVMADETLAAREARSGSAIPQPLAPDWRKRY